MWPLAIVMGLDAAQDMTKMPFSQGDDVVQSLSCFPNEPLGVGVAHGSLRRRLDDLDTVGFDDEIKRQETGVPIMDDKAACHLVIGKFHGQVPGLLLHPGRIGVGRAAGDVNSAGTEVNEKQHIKSDQTGFCPDLFGKEIGGPGDVQVRLDKSFPWNSGDTILNYQEVSGDRGL